MGTAPSRLTAKRKRRTIDDAISGMEILSSKRRSQDDELSEFPLTDLGNAERFERRFKDKLLYCSQLGWLSWDGRRWTKSGAEAARSRAEHETVRAIQAEAAAAKRRGMSELGEKLAKWGRISESSSHMKAASDCAASMMTVSLEQLDVDSMKFNVLNGTLHFRKREDGPYFELHPHSPKDLITRVAQVQFDREATCPTYDRFIHRVQPLEKARGDTQRFLHQWAGLSMTAHTGEQKFTFHVGKGRNGKSVWVAAIAHVMGDYATTIGIESLLDNGRRGSGSQASPDIAMLRGIRFLSTSEPGKGDTLNESFIKQLTGEDRIIARHLHKDFFEFRPVAKLTMQGNYRPKISGTDEGIWGRVILVPWNVFIPPAERDRDLPRKLEAESSGILNRMIDGLCDWMDNGLTIPKSVSEATAEYRSDSDPLARFLAACTEHKAGSRVATIEMHNLYLAWAKANGESLWTAKGFGSAMRDAGMHAIKSNTVFWLDLALTASPADFNAQNANDDHSRDGEADHG